MKRGQLFILAAFVIAMGIAALANLGYFTSLPVQKEQTAISSGGITLQNINSEIIYVNKMGVRNLTRIDDFIQFANNFSFEKNFEGQITRFTG